MARTIRSVLVILSLLGAAVSFTACGNSPTDVQQYEGFANDN